MKRLDFLKKLLYGATALAVAPKLLVGKSSNHKLVADAENKTTEDYHFFNGFCGYESFDDELLNADATPTNISQPYIIKIKNNRNVKIKNIVICNAKQTLKSKKFGLPRGVNITYNRDNKDSSYREFLKHTIDNPFTVGRTYSQAPMGGQSLVSIFINERQLTPVIDPYRQASNTITWSSFFKIDGSEKITLSELYPNSEYTFYFYPTNDLYSRKLVKHPNYNPPMVNNLIRPTDTGKI